MDPQISMFLQGWFSDETKGDPEGTRRSIENSPPEYQRALQQGLAEMISKRTLTTDEFWEITFVAVDDEEDLYRQLQEAYDYLFGRQTSTG